MRRESRGGEACSDNTTEQWTTKARKSQIGEVGRYLLWDTTWTVKGGRARDTLCQKGPRDRPRPDSRGFRCLFFFSPCISNGRSPPFHGTIRLEFPHSPNHLSHTPDLDAIILSWGSFFLLFILGLDEPGAVRPFVLLVRLCLPLLSWFWYGLGGWIGTKTHRFIYYTEAIHITYSALSLADLHGIFLRRGGDIGPIVDSIQRGVEVRCAIRVNDCENL